MLIATECFHKLHLLAVSRTSAQLPGTFTTSFSSLASHFKTSFAGVRRDLGSEKLKGDQERSSLSECPMIFPVEKIHNSHVCILTIALELKKKNALKAILIWDYICG